MKNSTKRVFKAIMIIVLLVAAYRLVSFVIDRVTSSGPVEEVKRIPVKAAAVRRIDMLSTLKLTGDIIGTEVVNVFPQVPGKIESILIKEGVRVGRGAVLFKINRDIVGMDYNLAIVESPISGHVGKIMVDRGMSVTNVTPLAQVVNMSSVEAVVRIMEESINRVEVGMRARIGVEAYPGKVFDGRVSKKSAVLDQLSRTQEVRIRLDNPGMRLKHGMFANIEIIMGSRPGVLALPVDAVMTGPDETKSVFVVQDGRARKRAIRTGITANHLTEVISGVDSGDIVVTLGQENLSDGDTLIVYREDESDAPEPQKAAAGEGR
ncbi:MAG: efflux RND transporter periplasmic adaptor subunit [Spirochaetes bacterium]|nr:efflux RND transporter periplasmic adaptor subunit [Spirochaetota bacterium]